MPSNQKTFRQLSVERIARQGGERTLVSYRRTCRPFQLIEVGKAVVRIYSFLLPYSPVAGTAFADHTR